MKQFRIYSLLAVVAVIIGISSCKDEEDPKPQPKAAFTFTLDTLAKNVTFTNQSTNSTAYSWDFGDGQTSTSESPQHTYTLNGNFIVKLTAVGEQGTNNSVFTDTITVPAPKNFVKGGSFETNDASQWTVIKLGQKDTDGNLTNVKYQFGYTTYKPTLGTEGSLFIFPTNDAPAKPNEEGTMFTQNLGNLTPGTYRISALMRFGGEDRNGAAGFATNYWIQLYIGKTVPQEATDYSGALQLMGWFYGAWTGWAYTVPAIDGAFPYGYLVPNLADENGNFTVEEAGTYYIVLKVGKGGGATFGNGIALDELTLNKLDANGNPIY